MDLCPTTEGGRSGSRRQGDTSVPCLVRDPHTSYSWFNNCCSKLPSRKPNPGKIWRLNYERENKFRLVLGTVVFVIGLPRGTTLRILACINKPGTLQKDHCNSNEAGKGRYQQIPPVVPYLRNCRMGQMCGGRKEPRFLQIVFKVGCL